jgi:hypothetical protein
MNWDDLVVTSDEIVKEFGQSITIKTVNQGTYDPETSEIINTVTDFITYGVIFDYGEKDVNGTTIVRGDKQLLITPVGLLTIDLNSTVVVQGTEYVITKIKQTNPAGTNLLWELSLRGVV